MHVHVYAWHYKAIKERLLLLPDTSFPFVFLFSVCSLRPLQFLCVSWNPGNVASSQCCCVLDQELLVLEWGGHASPLRKEGAWRDHSTLIACQNIHRSGGKRRMKRDREWLKEPKGYFGPVNSRKDSTFTHKSLHKERIMVKLHNISSHG